LTTAPSLVVSKGNDRAKISFAYPQDIRRAIDYGLDHGRDKKFMAAKPGEIMGYLAHGHPFLDGNGRTIMVLHCVLAQRAGFSIDWATTSKNDYLAALTKELEDPIRGIWMLISSHSSRALSHKASLRRTSPPHRALMTRAATLCSARPMIRN
jgi:cell filamentation protein